MELVFTREEIRVEKLGADQHLTAPDSQKAGSGRSVRQSFSPWRAVVVDLAA